MTSLSSSQPPSAQSQARAIIKAPSSPVQSFTRRSTPPIPIPKKSGAHAHKSSWGSGRSPDSQSTDSLQGSSPRISAFLLGLSANDVMSSSDRDIDSGDEQDRLPISRRQLDSSPEESDSEGSGSAWVSSLISKRKALSELPHRAWPATAPRPRARGVGGQLAAARAQTPAPALTALCPRFTTALGTVRPAPAPTADATAASLSALWPASTATAAPTAVAPSASLVVAAPAVSAETLAEALAAALSAGRSTATAALSPAQPDSAQALHADALQPALQADAVQLEDADDVAAFAGAKEADAVQPGQVHIAGRRC